MLTVECDFFRVAIKNGGLFGLLSANYLSLIN